MIADATLRKIFHYKPVTISELQMLLNLVTMPLDNVEDTDDTIAACICLLSPPNANCVTKEDYMHCRSRLAATVLLDLSERQTMRALQALLYMPARYRTPELNAWVTRCSDSDSEAVRQFANQLPKLPDRYDSGSEDSTQ